MIQYVEPTEEQRQAFYFFSLDASEVPVEDIKNLSKDYSVHVHHDQLENEQERLFCQSRNVSEFTNFQNKCDEILHQSWITQKSIVICEWICRFIESDTYY